MEDIAHPEHSYHVEHVLAEDGDVHHHKHKHTHHYENPKTHKGDHNMTENIYTGGMGSGLGAGLGGGLLGGVLGGALLGGNGLLGNRNGIDAGGAETRITDAAFNQAVLGKLGTIEGAIPFNEGQMQLALAGATAAIQSTANMNQDANQAGQAAVIAISNANQISTLGGLANIKDAVTTYGVANLQATKDAQYANAIAVSTSTKEILAAINSNEIANLNRQLTVAESRGMEDRFNARQSATTVDVTQTVNQNNLQSQSQAQAQQQAILLSNLATCVQGLMQQNQSIHNGIVNLGTMSGAAGQQTSANTRVN